jgi:hypothetical protein
MRIKMEKSVEVPDVHDKYVQYSLCKKEKSVGVPNVHDKICTVYANLKKNLLEFRFLISMLKYSLFEFMGHSKST